VNVGWRCGPGPEGAKNDVGFGRDLQQQRISRGVELEAIAESTRVSIRHLRALEDEKRSDLPGGVFNKGILRGYCQAVGLEEREWLNRFATSDLNASTEPDWAAFAESVKQHRVTRIRAGNRKWFGVVLMVAGLVALAWIAWHFTVRPHLVMHWTPAATTSSDASQGDAAPPLHYDSV
jgi:cytoskeletal protein RodZ